MIICLRCFDIPTWVLMSLPKRQDEYHGISDQGGYPKCSEKSVGSIWGYIQATRWGDPLSRLALQPLGSTAHRLRNVDNAAPMTVICTKSRVIKEASCSAIWSIRQSHRDAAKPGMRHTYTVLDFNDWKPAVSVLCLWSCFIHNRTHSSAPGTWATCIQAQYSLPPQDSFSLTWQYVLTR